MGLWTRRPVSSYPPRIVVMKALRLAMKAELTRFRIRAIALSLILVGVTGCGSTVLKNPVEGRGEGAELVVRKMKDGPDRFETSGTVFRAASGDRFLHLWVKLKNLSAEERAWDWTRCGLIGSVGSFELSVILFDMVVSAEAPRITKLGSHEEVGRHLVFAYPDDDTLPTKLVCGDVAVSFVL
jgi:hypothetical protein